MLTKCKNLPTIFYIIVEHYTLLTSFKFKITGTYQNNLVSVRVNKDLIGPMKKKGCCRLDSSILFSDRSGSVLFKR